MAREEMRRKLATFTAGVLGSPVRDLAAED